MSSLQFIMILCHVPTFLSITKQCSSKYCVCSWRKWKSSTYGFTYDVHKSISDPPVHPAVDDGVDASVRDCQNVNDGEDVGEGR